MRNLVLIGFIFQILLVAACSRPADPDQTAVAEPDFEAEVEEYIRRFPYQDTYDYVAYYTRGLLHRGRSGQDEYMVVW